MIRAVILLLAFWVAQASFPAYSMQPLDDTDMAGITGYEGVALALELRVNMSESGVPLGMAGAASEYGTSCIGINNPCRWALSFANRDNVWLVFNGWSLALRVNDIFLDVVPELTPLSVPGFNLAMADDRVPSDNRFFNVNGECMLANCSVVSDIPTSIQGMPAMKLSTPATTLAYDSSTNTSSGFTNTQVSLYLDGVAAITAPDGYSAPVPGTFMGAQIGDIQAGNNFAGWAFQGDVYVFGY
ncbi:MAG: hypothetical protein LAT61_04720 [Alcanivorax sp.]|nr:hypothetical protein [Alcanivorax sp.]